MGIVEMIHQLTSHGRLSIDKDLVAPGTWNVDIDLRSEPDEDWHHGAEGITLHEALSSLVAECVAWGWKRRYLVPRPRP